MGEISRASLSWVGMGLSGFLAAVLARVLGRGAGEGVLGRRVLGDVVEPGAAAEPGRAVGVDVPAG